MVFNDKGLTLLKSFESCRLKAYLDTGGVPTIGWGRAHGVKVGDTCTQAQADAWLLDDLKVSIAGVKALVRPPVSDNAFSALVCFAFNVGLHSLANSTLLRLLNGGADKAQVAAQFLRWDKDNGVSVPGLLRRREAEKDLFIS